MKDIQPIQYKNTVVATTQIISEFLGTEENNIKVNFSNNKNKFIEGKHYFNLSHEEVKEINLQNYYGTKGVKLWTERGCARHSKLLQTQESWDLWEDMEDTYFSAKQPSIDNLSRVEILQLALDSEKEKIKLEEIKLQLEHKIIEDTPKVEFFEKVTIAHDAIAVSKAAKLIGTGRRRLFSFMRNIGWVNRKNEPYQAKIESGYLDVKLGNWTHPEHGLQQSVTALVTGKGLTQLQKLWGKKYNNVMA
jgi:phage antirepressor YoqD-like protein